MFGGVEEVREYVGTDLSGGLMVVLVVWMEVDGVCRD